MDVLSGTRMVLNRDDDTVLVSIGVLDLLGGIVKTEKEIIGKCLKLEGNCCEFYKFTMGCNMFTRSFPRGCGWSAFLFRPT